MKHPNGIVDWGGYERRLEVLAAHGHRGEPGGDWRTCTAGDCAEARAFIDRFDCRPWHGAENGIPPIFLV